MTAPESGELNSPHERLRRSEGSGMLIVTLYGEGSNASSTDKESNVPEAAESQRSAGSSVLINDPLR